MSTWRYVLGVTLYAIASGTVALLTLLGLVGLPVIVVAWLMGVGR